MTVMKNNRGLADERFVINDERFDYLIICDRKNELKLQQLKYN